MAVVLKIGINYLEPRTGIALHAGLDTNSVVVVDKEGMDAVVSYFRENPDMEAKLIAHLHEYKRIMKQRNGEQ